MKTRLAPLVLLVLLTLILSSGRAPTAAASAGLLADQAQIRPSGVAYNHNSGQSCVDDSRFVGDVTVRDNSQMDPGQDFVKTWRLRNSGTCTWTEQYRLVFRNNYRLGASASVALRRDVRPGQTYDVSVPMTAPQSPGRYRGTWQLRAANGNLVGRPIWVQIVVPDLLDWLKDDVYFASGGGGGVTCASLPNRPTAQDRLPAVRETAMRLRSKMVCVYGIELDEALRLSLYGPDGEYVASETVRLVPDSTCSNEYETHRSTDRPRGFCDAGVVRGVSWVSLYLWSPAGLEEGSWTLVARSGSQRVQSRIRMDAAGTSTMASLRINPFENRDCASYVSGNRVYIRGTGLEANKALPLGIYYSGRQTDNGGAPLVFSTIVRTDSRGSFTTAVYVEDSDPPGFYYAVPASEPMESRMQSAFEACFQVR